MTCWFGSGGIRVGERPGGTLCGPAACLALRTRMVRRTGLRLAVWRSTLTNAGTRQPRPAQRAWVPQAGQLRIARVPPVVPESVNVGNDLSLTTLGSHFRRHVIAEHCR
jgi:hypothetical protein